MQQQATAQSSRHQDWNNRALFVVTAAVDFFFKKKEPALSCEQAS
jgi:hypothetical protein